MTECKHCGKVLPSEKAVEQHTASKHSTQKHHVEVKTQKNKMPFVYGLVIILIAGGIYWTYSLSVTSGSELDEFAQCLTDNGATFYGAFWCPHCDEQKGIFGNSVKHVNYVECSTPDRRGQTPACIAKNIQSYPTWEFDDGSRLNGVVQLNQLAQKTGCELN